MAPVTVAQYEPASCFKILPLISRATLEQQRLEIKYYSRGKNETRIRQISPQRLTRYRDNWYLDAWCHLEQGLRSFSLDCIKEAQFLKISCKNIDETPLNKHYATSFGIFAGEPNQMARLLLTPFRARWVANEIWHPQQQGHTRKDGSYELQIPYNADHELIMEICKYGPDVKVQSPASLQKAVATKLKQAATQYE